MNKIFTVYGSAVPGAKWAATFYAPNGIKNKFEINDVHTNVYKTSLKNGNYNIVISKRSGRLVVAPRNRNSRAFSPAQTRRSCRRANRGALATTNKSIPARECHTSFNLKHEYCYDTASSSYIIMIRSAERLKNRFGRPRPGRAYIRRCGFFDSLVFVKRPTDDYILLKRDTRI